MNEPYSDYFHAICFCEEQRAASQLSASPRSPRRAPHNHNDIKYQIAPIPPPRSFLYSCGVIKTFISSFALVRSRRNPTLT